MVGKRVAVIGAGGTIAMEGAHAFDWVDYGDTGIIHSVETLVERLDIGLAGVTLVPCPLRALPSTGITPADWIALAAKIDELIATDPDLDGIVVTHGTASLEETAFFLHLVHRHALPVVLVGAQRPPNTAASDAVANLRGAVAAAACPDLRGQGVLVALHGYVHAAESVAKLANHTLDAFQSLEFGPLARIEPDGTLFVARRLPEGRRPLFDLPAGPVPRVDIAFSYAGADGASIDAFVAAGAQGIVLAGFAPGRSTPGERQAASRAVAAGLTVVQSSRAAMGRVPLQRYNTADGILSGGGLSPQKLRILVMLALGQGLPAGEIQDLLLSF
jgi:L-asparaginase